MGPGLTQPEESIYRRGRLFPGLMGECAFQLVHAPHAVGPVDADNAPMDTCKLHVGFFELPAECAEFAQRLVGPNVAQLFGIRPELLPGHRGQVIGLGEVRPRGSGVAEGLEIADVARADLSDVSFQFDPISFRKRDNRPYEQMHVDVGGPLAVLPGQFRAAQADLGLFAEPLAPVNPTDNLREMPEGFANLRQRHSWALG